MTIDEFNDKYTKMEGITGNRLITKAKQYGNAEDRYIQFKFFAHFAHCNMLSAIWYQVIKHLARLGIIIEDKKELTEVEADELFGDIISYFYLMWGLYKHE